MPINDNSTIILDNLSQALAAQTPQITRELLQRSITGLNQYLNDLNNFYIKLQNQSRPIIQQYKEANATDTTIGYALYKQLIYSDTEIEKLLKQGYILIERLRNFFTNETITYAVGIQSKGMLYEKNLTMEEILQYTTVQYNTRSKIENLFKLRITDKKGIKQSLTTAADTVEKIVNDNPSSVYSAIRRYTLLSTNYKDKNKGNAYQVYKRILALRNGKNRIPPQITDDEIRIMFDEVRKNTASSAKGGDYLQQQIKFFGNAPSLVTTNLIKQTLTEIFLSLQQFLKGGDSQKLKEAIKSIFVKDKQLQQTADEAQQAASEKAISYIDSIVDQLSLNEI